MNRKPGLNSFPVSKTVLIVASTCVDSARRSDYLRSRGFHVDCASKADIAVHMGRTKNYDLIVLTLDEDPSILENLAGELQMSNPDAMITCLADCKKPIPPLPCDYLLWMGEPLEYFAARVEALAAVA